MRAIIETGYLLDSDVVDYEGLHRSQDRINVLIRWGVGGPEGMEGTIAAEALFTFTEGNQELLLKIEDNCEVDEDLVRAVCQVYCIRGVVDVSVVRMSQIRDLGTVRVR